MSELVPLADHKRTAFEMWRDLESYRYDTDQLTSDQEALIGKHIELRFYFGAHGTEADNYLEVERAFDDFDPKNTIVCFENAAFSVTSEADQRSLALNAPVSQRMRMQREAVLKSRNSQGANYLASLNSFSYAQGFCVANGYDIRFVDLDLWTDRHWREYMLAADDVENKPVLHESTAELLQQDWVDLDLMDAVTQYRRIHEDNTAIISTGDQYPLIVFKWGEYHRIREEAVVRKLKGLALEEAERLEKQAQAGEPADRLKIALFYGAGHARGIQQRMNNLHLPYTVIHMGSIKALDSAPDVEMDTSAIYPFIRQWLVYRLYENFGSMYTSDEQNLLKDRVDATIDACTQIPVSDLSEMYEAYRAFTRWYNNDEPPKSNLQKALREHRKQLDNPPAVLQRLLDAMFAKSGKDLASILQDYTHRRMSASEKLFGRESDSLSLPS